MTPAKWYCSNKPLENCNKLLRKSWLRGFAISTGLSWVVVFIGSLMCPAVDCLWDRAMGVSGPYVPHPLSNQLERVLMVMARMPGWASLVRTLLLLASHSNFPLAKASHRTESRVTVGDNLKLPNRTEVWWSLGHLLEDLFCSINLFAYFSYVVLSIVVSGNHVPWVLWFKNILSCVGFLQFHINIKTVCQFLQKFLLRVWFGLHWTHRQIQRKLNILRLLNLIVNEHGISLIWSSLVSFRNAFLNTSCISVIIKLIFKYFDCCLYHEWIFLFLITHC